MRNIRRAALAGATALAVSLTGVVAHADEAAKSTDAKSNSSVTELKDKAKGKLEGSSAFQKLEGSSEAKAEDKNTKATAETEKKDPETKNLFGSSENGEFNWGKKLEGDKAVDGRTVYGSTKGEFDKLPAWAKLLQVGSIAGVISAFLGLVVFPVYNFLKYNGFIR
ncbi:hypothetical protein [Corynebacterium aquilae]|uniref:hypothetical protein n=1 Tax=Corynebacterium aquilae TaxID=203263 RepID=UPI000953393E|nr:hypothetical protein [Corynebacterium aquilae]